MHLGRGKWAGEQVVAYGKYVDELVFVAPGSGDGGAGDGARDGLEEGVGVGEGGAEGNGEGSGEGSGGVGGGKGKWLISKRTVTFFGRVGEEGVMSGET